MFFLKDGTHNVSKEFTLNFLDRSTEKTPLPTTVSTTPAIPVLVPKTSTVLQLPFELQNRHLPTFSQKSVLFTVMQNFPLNQALIGDRLMVEDKDRVLLN